MTFIWQMDCQSFWKSRILTTGTWANTIRFIIQFELFHRMFGIFFVPHNVHVYNITHDYLSIHTQSLHVCKYHIIHHICKYISGLKLIDTRNSHIHFITHTFVIPWTVYHHSVLVKTMPLLSAQLFFSKPWINWMIRVQSIPRCHGSVCFHILRVKCSPLRGD